MPPRTMTTADIDYVASFQAVLSHRRALRRLGFACYARSCCSQQRGDVSTIAAAPFRYLTYITTAVWGVQLRNRQEALTAFLASVFYADFSASRRPTTRLRQGYERFSTAGGRYSKRGFVGPAFWGPTLLCASHACYHYEQTSAARSFTSALILQRVLALAVASASSYRLLSLAALTCVRRQPVVVRATAMGFRCRGGA